MIFRMFRTFAVCFALATLGCQQGPVYDIVIAGGRVMDPASGLDAPRNIGVQDGRIAAVSENELAGETVLDASGLVVAPGFIDLHQHGQSPENYKALAHDGVTSALELEIGVENVSEWYAEREGKAAINYGAAVSHTYNRSAVMIGHSTGLSANESSDLPMTPEQMEALEKLLAQGLDEGAVAVGFGIAYAAGSTQAELNRSFAVAAPYGASCHVHMRTDRDSFANLDEVLEASESSGAPLHIVHINSSGRDRALEYLERIQAARDRGIDVTTECYPYNRGSTVIESSQFDDWKTYTDDYIGEFTWVETGESLTRETFRKYREQGGTIISPPAYSLDTVRALVAHPLTIIASDGMWIDNGRAHPRTFGTFSRVLGRYVREEKALSLMDALAKMTIRPAQRLERRAPMMERKGRLAVGADADIVVFNPETVLDQGTYEDPARYSSGFRYVLVNGAPAVLDGEFVEGGTAGQAIRAETAQGEEQDSGS